MLGKSRVANQIALNRATIKPCFTVGVVYSRHTTTILLALSNFLIWFLLIVSVVCLMR